MDYAALLYDPIYAALGVEATLTPAGSAAAVAVTVIDKTAGVDLAAGTENAEGLTVDLQTVRPVAAVRAAELTEQGVALDDLEEGTIAFNGKTWRMKSYLPKPSPTGEATGEIYLILIEAA